MAGDVFWAASDVGWVVGHSYIVYAPLLRGCTTVSVTRASRSGRPDAGRVLAGDRRVRCQRAVFTAPTAFRAIKARGPGREACIKKYDLSHFANAVPGRRALRSGYASVGGRNLGVPVIDHWWQTETGWTIAGESAWGSGALPVKYGSPTRRHAGL